MNAKQFVDKWGKARLKEISASQSHFDDICSLIGHPTPSKADPKGKSFTFEKSAKKIGGKLGRADVWYKSKFIWEYKGYHANLEKAYQQLLLYREYLGNPPLLITSDMHKIVIHTNFTDSIKEIHEIQLEDLLKKEKLDLLKKVFFNPNSLKPDKSQVQVTKETAETFIKVAETLQKWAKEDKGEYKPEKLAHLIVLFLFSLFAEDMKLLPGELFTKLVNQGEAGTTDFEKRIKELFEAMRKGGKYGKYKIPYFDGNLFKDSYVPEMQWDVLSDLKIVCELDWSQIDPSILGTLFERVIDESKRSQLGAHYTSKEDIMLLVEPVLMQPLRHEWRDVEMKVEKLVKNKKNKEALSFLNNFSKRISSLKILDPACGSGNFLYVALKQLLDLQKLVISTAGRHGLGVIPLTVNPGQLYGIEINQYAYELAQVTVWIGYIQWKFENGFREIQEPILQKLNNIKLMDAVLKRNSDGKLTNPKWPSVDVILGNPPFIGNKKMRKELTSEYVHDLRKLFEGKIPGASDFVCYWFERARMQVVAGKTDRCGLLATQAIRGGKNRKVLENIKKDGNIFFGISDRVWYQEGVSVHVSLIGFDNGTQKSKILNGETVDNINSDLTSTTDLTITKSLPENSGLAFIGSQKGGSFDISSGVAKSMLESKENTPNHPNSDVVRPWVNGKDITSRPRKMWIIDFGIDMPLEKAKQYKAPFKYVKEHVKVKREKENSEKRSTERWWLHQRPRPEFREATKSLKRYIATPRVSKHRVFVWMDSDILPDSAVVAIARDDDYFFGVLHSSLHELWSRNTGTQLREIESGFRYSQTLTFETFPFPRNISGKPNKSNISNISSNAAELVKFRQLWLNPPVEEIGITISEQAVKKRTYTVLYNALETYRAEVKGKEFSSKKWEKVYKNLISLDEINKLDHLHSKLDETVLKAYGWEVGLSGNECLKRLLALNQNALKPKR